MDRITLRIQSHAQSIPYRGKKPANWTAHFLRYEDSEPELSDVSDEGEEEEGDEDEEDEEEEEEVEEGALLPPSMCIENLD